MAAGKRSGFTLLEILLVLGVVAAVVALSWPNMVGLLRHKYLQESAESVRNVLDRARVVAVEEGRAMQVRFEMGGSRYVFLPEAPFDGSLIVSSDPSKKTGPRRDPFHVYQLNEKCTFFINPEDPAMKNIQAEQLTQQWLAYLDNADLAGGVSWTSPIVFFPDGTATDGKTILIDPDQQAIEIWVRGLTGGVAQNRMTSVLELTNGRR